MRKLPIISAKYAGAALLTALCGTVAHGTSYTPVSECGTVIDAPGKYRVVQDIDCSDQSNPLAIRIVNTSNVELRLDGYEIKGRYNPTYGGVGRGIWIVQSTDIEIDGRNSSSSILNFANAILVQESNEVKIDGDRMRLRDNATALIVTQSQDVEVKQLRFSGNRQRDLQINQSAEVKVRDTDHFGTTLQGILVSDSQSVEIRDANIGQQGKVNRAVIFYNTANSTLRDSRIDQADVGVLFQGQATHSNELDDNKFGRNSANACDLQILFGAESPEERGNSPDTLTLCP